MKHLNQKRALDMCQSSDELRDLLERMPRLVVTPFGAVPARSAEEADRAVTVAAWAMITIGVLTCAGVIWLAALSMPLLAR